MVDLDSRLNSLRVKRESTTCHRRMSYTTGPQLFMTRTITKRNMVQGQSTVHRQLKIQDNVRFANTGITNEDNL